MEPTPRSQVWVEKIKRRAKYVVGRVIWGANYVLIGSSHMARIQSTQAYRAIWEHYFGPEFVNVANGGDCIKNTLWVIDQYNLPGSCDVAAVCIGGNDIARGHRPVDVAKGIKKVALKLQKNNPKTLILLSGIFPGDKKPLKIIGKVNNILMDITRNCENIYYLPPNFKEWADHHGHLKKELDSGDHPHLSSAGYRLLVRYFADIAQLSVKFRENCSVPYARPQDSDPTVRYGIGEPYTFYTTDSDPGVPRGPWYKAPPLPHFNRAPREASSSESEVSRSVGLPGTRVVTHLGGSVVHGAISL